MTLSETRSGFWKSNFWNQFACLRRFHRRFLERVADSPSSPIPPLTPSSASGTLASRRWRESEGVGIVKTFINPGDLKQECQLWRKAGEAIAFIPTMGALHEGHLSLIRMARSQAPKVILSIFVNPLQFAPGEDFATYPRMLADDLHRLKGTDVDAVFLPNTGTLYPNDFQTYVVNDEMSKPLCGASRPGHFRGVLTVVLKLFHLVDPDMAIFGEKDFQQLRLIEKMVEDLCLHTQVIRAPTIRETDGLAMSSRNLKLRPQHREMAAQLYAGLRLVEETRQGGENQSEVLVKVFCDHIAKTPEFQLEYCEIRDDMLRQIQNVATGANRCFAAARLGDVRLIDNWSLN